MDRIAQSDESVFLTREFSHLGCERHVLRGLRQLVDDGRLIRLGYGVYGRAETSGLTGRPRLAASGGFIDAAQQALDKLGVPWEPMKQHPSDDEDVSTTASVNPAVRVVNNRITRKIRHQGHELIMERG